MNKKKKLAEIHPLNWGGGEDWERELPPDELDALIRDSDLYIERYGRDLFQDPDGEFIEYSDLSYIIPVAVRRALSSKPGVDVEAIERMAQEARKVGYAAMGLVNTPKTRSSAAVAVNHFRDAIIATLQADESTDTEGEG